MPRVWPISGGTLFRHRIVVTLASWTPLSGWSGGRRSVDTFVPEPCPGDAGCLIGHGDQHEVCRPPRQELVAPAGTRARLGAGPDRFHRRQHRPAALDGAADVGSQAVGRVRKGMDILHALTRTIRPTLLPSDGVLRQEWLSTSLLGTLAMMVLLDLTERRRILTCEKCGGVFVTKAYQARYCSDRCRFTAQKRRHRARQKGKVK